MTTWNPNHYLQFADERTRPAVDLVSRIQLPNPRTLVDLGCGPGNSTQVLRQRWPQAHLLGIDKSPEMIAAARSKYPDQEWLLGDVSKWKAEKPVDLVFSNAAFQWVPNHQHLITHLFAQVTDGGALAFQIPSNRYAEVRLHLHEIAEDPIWRERMHGPKSALIIEEPDFYYETLAEQANNLDIWETEYHHIMDSPEAIVDWISSTGLRPFLQVLADEQERELFTSKLQKSVRTSYPKCKNGKVLFPFRRLFVVAYR